MAGEAVKTIELKKTYKNGVEALKGIDIEIRRNRITCLLGPNGAGKTTFLRIIATQLLPTSGEAYVLGYDVVEDAEEIRKHVAVVPQEGKPFNMVTPWDEIYFGARIRGFSRAEARRKTEEILKLLGIFEQRNTKILHLSGGQKQKVLIGRTLVSDADILFLDEPTIGLDPISRRIIWEDIIRLKESGKTILLTTHYMEEAEALADELYLINKGRLLTSGTVSSILSSIDMDTVVYIIGDDSVESSLDGWDYEKIGNKYLVKVEDRSDLYILVKMAVEKGYMITVRPPSLEDVFIKLVGGDVYEEKSG